MESLHPLQKLGLELPGPGYIAGAILFGILGFAAYRHGRRSARGLTTGLGVALMVYPYAVSRTWILYAVGFALCAALVLDLRRDP